MKKVGMLVGLAAAVFFCLLVQNFYSSSMNVITPRARAHSLMSVLLHRIEASARHLGRPPADLAEIFGSEGSGGALTQWRCEVRYTLNEQGAIAISAIPLDRNATIDVSGAASFQGEAYGQDGSVLAAEDGWARYAILEVFDGLPD